MSRENHARRGAQSAIPDETVLDVAVATPHSLSLFHTVGRTQRFRDSRPFLWGTPAVAVQRQGPPEVIGGYSTIILALTPMRLHILGRHAAHHARGWQGLTTLGHIERRDLEVRRETETTDGILLIDRTTRCRLGFEPPRRDDLELDALLRALEAA